MITISLCMIVKNEEKTLGRCLESVRDLVEEINIVDTGSTDKTKEICRKFKANIYDFEWIEDFSAARNFAFSKATKEYILWLDADDVILEADRIKFKQLKKQLDNEIDVVMMRYNLGSDEKGNAVTTFYRERLLKRSKDFKWKDPIHEYISFGGKVINTDIAITHKKIHRGSDRNLKIFEKMIAEGKELSNRNIFYYARELYFNGKFDAAIEYYLKFLETEDGLMSNYIDSCIDLSNCYKAKKEYKKALSALLKSFEFDTPRAEICCQLGAYYKSKEDYTKAIFWYKLASTLERPKENWGSVSPDCYGYIPYMELCACYFKSGNLAEAIKNNDKAGEYKPEDPLVLHNKKYFKMLLSSVEKVSENN